MQKPLSVEKLLSHNKIVRKCKLGHVDDSLINEGILSLYLIFLVLSLVNFPIKWLTKLLLKLLKLAIFR